MKYYIALSFLFLSIFAFGQVANNVTNQVICDNNNDGLWVFNLDALRPFVLGSQNASDYTVTFHLSSPDANSNTGALPNLYENEDPYIPQTIYVRITDNSNPSSFGTNSFRILVFNQPLVNTVPDQVICDTNNDGFAEFDLAALETVVLGTQSAGDYNVTFHATQNTADLGGSPISSPYTNPVAYQQETIFVRIENDSFSGCYDTTSFTVDVINKPTANVVPSQLACDTNNDGIINFNLATLETVVLGTQDASDFTITFHPTQNDADSSGTQLSSPYQNSTAYGEEDIFVRIENNSKTGCYDTTRFKIDVFDQPTANAVENQIICDDNEDGFWDFDLGVLRTVVLGAQPAGDYTVSFHPSLADADANTGALPNSYENQASYVSETLTVRIQNNANAGCYATTAFDIGFFNAGIVNAIPSQLICDDDDGFWDFDFGALRTVVLGTELAGDYTLTFHPSLADADANTIALPDLYRNQAAYVSETLTIRIENNVSTDCYATIAFDIGVFKRITANTVPDQLICDDDNDGFWDFDLDALRSVVLGSQPVGDYTITFHPSLADANANTDALPDSYENQAAYEEESIYVRIENKNSVSCYNTTRFIIDVFDQPTANAVPNQVICDDNDDGFLFFDLDALRSVVLGTQSAVDFAVTFHPSLADADANTGVLPNLYRNQAAYVSETLTVRIENSGNNTCYATTDFDITVNPLPDANVSVANLFECESNTDFLFDFDLESKTDEVLNGQDPLQFAVTYYVSQADANNLVDPLVSPHANTSNPQQIFIAITNNTTGCSVSTLSFEIKVNESIDVNPDGTPVLYEICDNVLDNDGFAQFDLTTQTAGLLDGQDPAAFTLTYHDSFDNAFDNVQPLPTLYENLTNPQTLYVRMIDNETPDECFGIGELTLQVNLLPVFDLEDDYILCLSSNDTATVDVQPVLDTSLSATDYSFEWRFNGAVLSAETAPSLIPTQGGTYAVTVTDTRASLVTACTNFDEAEVIESGIIDNFDVSVTSQTFTGNNTIVAVATGISTYEYSLDNGPWFTRGDFENVTGGEHVVAVRDVNGCGIITQNVMVIDYPKFFTPNGDGNNDTWNIKGIFTQPSAVIYIFDRYGKLLKQLSPTGSGWDGTYRGNLMPSNDYWFSLDYREPITGTAKNFKSHFTLKR